MPNRKIQHLEIHIEGIDANNKLKLNPDPANANSDDTVTWIIDASSGVASIDAIYNKSGSQNNVFDSGPGPVRDSKAWKGTIRQVDASTTENYAIVYTKTTGGQFTYDPVIQANP